MIGTNCGNCRFFTGPATRFVNLNKQGGYKSASDARAANADLITLPGRALPTKARDCTNPYVAQPVTDRMCCNFWDNAGALREFK